MDPVSRLTSVDSKHSSVAREKKRRRKLRRKLFLRHHRGHWEELIRGTIPIFVAATINKVVSQLLELIVGSGGFRLHLAVTSIYAIFVAHILGYIVAYNVAPDDPAADFYETLVSDNASFAWSSCLTLVIISWVYSDYPLSAAIGAWLVLIALVHVFIYFVNYIQEVWLVAPPEIRRRLRDFESDSFALAAAYSMTVIIAATVYHDDATDYLSNTDDLNSVDKEFDDKLDAKKLVWLFFLYAALSTIVIIALQWRIDKRLKHQAAKHVAQDLQRRSSGVSFDEMQQLLDDREEEEVEAVQMGDKGSVKRYLIEKFLFWDEDKHCVQAFRRCYYTTLAYTVSSAWHVWSIMSFQNFFQFNQGPLFGLFLFALLSTFSVALLMTVVSVKKELWGLGLNSYDSLSSHSFSLPSATLGDHEGILYVTFGRLTVGWAWQTFFTGAVAAFLPSSELSSERSRLGLALLLKVVIATLVGYLGYRLELYLSQRKAVKQHAYEISMQQRARIDLIEGDEASSTAGMSQNLL